MAADPANVWTESKNIQLIREFRKRPILWDQGNHLFYKKEFKKWAWVEVSKVVQMPVERCTSKMSILMSSFRREKSKMVNTLKNATDPAEAYQSSWYGFQEMAFLLDKDKERKLHSTGNDDDEDKKPRILKRTSTQAGHHKVEKKLKKISLSPAPVVKLKPLERSSLGNDKHDLILQPKKVIDESVLKTYPGSRKQQLIIASQSRADEIIFFANFIASKMMKYSDTTKNAAQQAICDVIFKADQNHFEPQANVNDDCDPLNQPSGSVELTSSDYGLMKIYFSDSD